MRTTLIAAATVLATMSVTASSFADEPAPMNGAPMNGAPMNGAPMNGAPATGAPATTMPATTTPTTTAAPAPTSMTTTTAADTEAPVPPSASMSTNADRTTLYDRRRPNRPLLITGGLILAGSYATTAALAANEGSIRDHDLYIPIAGPWINLASRDSGASNNTRDTVLIAGSGVLQAAGAGMFIASFIIPEKVATATIAAGPVKMHLTPTAAAGAGGVGAFGTF